MNCRDFRTSHLDFTDQTLSAERLAAASLHLEACADCARFDALVRRSLMLVHSLPSVAPDRRLDPRRTAQRARISGATLAPRRFVLSLPGLTAAASVAFAAGLLSAAFLFRHPAGAALALPPVVAFAAPPAPAPVFSGAPERAPLMRADFMSGPSGGIPLWSSASLIDEAPARFVSAQLISAVPAR